MNIYSLRNTLAEIVETAAPGLVIGFADITAVQYLSSNLGMAQNTAQLCQLAVVGAVAMYRYCCNKSEKALVWGVIWENPAS